MADFGLIFNGDPFRLNFLLAKELIKSVSNLQSIKKGVINSLLVAKKVKNILFPRFWSRFLVPKQLITPVSNLQSIYQEVDNSLLVIKELNNISFHIFWFLRNNVRTYRFYIRSYYKKKIIASKTDPFSPVSIKKWYKLGLTLKGVWEAKWCRRLLLNTLNWVFLIFMISWYIVEVLYSVKQRWWYLKRWWTR